MLKKNFAIYFILLSVFFKTSFQTETELKQVAQEEDQIFQEDETLQKSNPGMLRYLGKKIYNGVGYFANGIMDAIIGLGSLFKRGYNGTKIFFGFGQKPNYVNEDTQKVEDTDLPKLEEMIIL